MPLLNDDVYNGCSHPNMYEFFNKIAHIVCFGQEMLLLVVKSYCDYVCNYESSRFSLIVFIMKLYFFASFFHV